MFPPVPAIRDATDADGEALAALIATCFADYPGCLFIRDEFPELRRPASHYAGKGGMLRVVDGPDGGIVGSIAAWPVPEQDAVEIGKVYVDAALRGGGLAQRLFADAVAFAQSRGACALMLWSDTRFTRAHRFYERLGFRRWPGERHLGDVSASIEWHFRRPLGGDMP
jgi:putative acetyltransferase